MHLPVSISNIIDASPQQIVSFLFVVVITSLLFIRFDFSPDSLAWFAHMVFENLGFGLMFKWAGNLASHSGDGTVSPPGSPNGSEKKKLKKKHIRSRVELQDGSPGPDYHYPGLVNISGTYCFLNSTLQAMASLSYLQPHIEAVHEKAEALDVPTPVIDALRDELIALNTPASNPSPRRPIQIIQALSTPTPGFKRGTLFSSREHQDAQELFQLISETVKEEAMAVDKEGFRDRGLGELGDTSSQSFIREPGKGVFEGLTANRRSCVECGYTEAVMHFSFDNLQLAVPRMPTISLEDCLENFTRLEILSDCICRKCSMLATHRRLVAEAEKQSLPAEGPETSSKKKRIREAKKLAARVQLALNEGRIEDDVKGVKMDKVFSRCSTKQAMIGRPPFILALHLNRSTFSGQYAGKNHCHVIFPEILDITAYTTSGQLSTQPSAPISTPPPGLYPRASTPTQEAYSIPRILYRLSAVVCHYGAHSFGHYVAFRRKPRPPTAGHTRWTPPTMACPLGCECELCTLYGNVREEIPNAKSVFRYGGWLRISDDSVSEVGIDAVLRETSSTFMLYYERVVAFRPPVELLMRRVSPRSSEETVRPKPDLPKQTSEARVVRSVFAGRKGKQRASEEPMGNGHAKVMNGDALATFENDSLESLDSPPTSPPHSSLPAVESLSSPLPPSPPSSPPPILPNQLPPSSSNSVKCTSSLPSWPSDPALSLPPSKPPHLHSTRQHLKAPQPISPVPAVGLRA